MTEPVIAGAAGPAEDSLVWFALLFSPAQSREPVAALYGLHEELRRIGARLREPDPARLRLAWWREELEQMAAGRARHPQARRLAAALAEAPSRTELELLDELVYAAEQDLDRQAFGSIDELRLYAFRSGGALQRLVAGALGAREEPAQKAAQGLGLGQRLTEIACDLGADLRRGRCYLPLDVADAAGLDLERFDPDRPAEGWGEALRPVLETARREIDRANVSAEAMPHTQRVLLALYRRLLERVEREPEAALAPSPVRLPPVARLWTAWRSARASIRQS